MGIVEYYAKQLVALDNHVYVVERYVVSLKQLIIAAYAQSGEHTSSRFLEFWGVDYMQLHTRWEHTPFVLADSDECYTLLTQIGMPNKSGRYLFRAYSNSLQCQVICGDFHILEAMPEA